MKKNKLKKIEIISFIGNKEDNTFREIEVVDNETGEEWEGRLIRRGK